MKLRIVIAVLCFSFILGSCTLMTRVISTEVTVPTQNPPSIMPTVTWWVTPQITATPISVTLNENIKIDDVIKQLHPGICTSFNLAIETPQPVDVPPPYTLKFIEVNEQPNPNLYYYEEIADNIDKSRQAFIACKPESCQDKVYVKENKTGKVYEIDFGAMTWRPIQWLTWINNDTLVFAQSSNPHYGLIVAVNLDKKEYQYYGMATDECLQNTITP